MLLSSPEALLTLLGLPGVGPRAVERLAPHFRDLDAVRGAPAEALARRATAAALRGLTDAAAWGKAAAAVAPTLERAERIGARLITLGDADYPAHLRLIEDRPLLLYLRGALRPDPRAVACVGTRRPTAFGRAATLQISGALARAGWSVVSGLALGVDALAHRAALDAGGHTVALLGSGVDRIFPKENAALAARILEAGGALLSEQPLGARPAPRSLVARDRLQSGMSVGTIAMQTGLVGGTMHTARFTLTQGRRLFAPVPARAEAEAHNNQGIWALTQETGARLAELLEARGAYARLLRERFGERPVAMGLAGPEDGARLLRALEAGLDGLNQMGATLL